MHQTLRIALWNANGLGQHSQEVKIFLINQNIDIMLISETHFTNKSYIKIPQYTIYDTKHPDGTGHGGTAVIIKNKIKHFELKEHRKEHIQATSIKVEEFNKTITISAVYCPPKHTIKKEQFEEFYQTLGPRFIAGGDYNAKHQQWGSRLATPRGRELQKTMLKNNLNQVSTGEPTYWPTDRRKIPDVIDFCITKGISNNYLKAESCLDLSSDHSPVIITYSTQVITKNKPPSLYNKHTSWDHFRQSIDENLNCNVPLKTEEDLNNAVEQFNHTIQIAAWNATPEMGRKDQAGECSLLIKQKITEKRNMRKQWQLSRDPKAKTKLNRAVKELKQLLDESKNENIRTYLNELTPTSATDYSLWKATKRLKQPQISIPPIKMENGNWARNELEKASTFASHLRRVFQPFDKEHPAEEETYIHEFLEAPFQMDLPIKNITLQEVQLLIKNTLNVKKAPGYELISGKVIKELPKKAIRVMTIIFNACLRLGVFPEQWKVAEIILIPKPGKNPEEVTSYRPISLLPVMSKLFEKILLQKLKPILTEKKLIPDHQFGFRQEHGTVEQIHRVVKKINDALHMKTYCSAAFLDISQAFDKVWHTGLLYKLKRELPYNFYLLLKSYLSDRFYYVKYQEERSPLLPIKSGVPQGSVLGPVLYLLYTADLPTLQQTEVATFADDTAVLASHSNPKEASHMLQKNLDKIQHWLKTWRIKANESKSVQVTFTMRKETCPPVTLNGRQLPQADEAKYLGMYLDRRLTWKKHIWTKRKQLGTKLRSMYWMLGKRSKLALHNKVMIYKSIFQPIWTYGCQLWGSTSKTNILKIERFQNKLLRIIANAPWFVPNWIIQQDLQMYSVQSVIKKLSESYKLRLSEHPNQLATRLLVQSSVKRLKKHDPLELPTRFI